MSRHLIACLFLVFPLSLAAAEPPVRDLGTELLAETGTAAVLASPRVQAALADPGPFSGELGAPRRQRLLDDAGFRAWRGERLWVLEWRRENGVDAWRPVSVVWSPRLHARGCDLVTAAPLPAAVQAIGFLVPGKVTPSLSALLAAYGADGLVLVKGQEWSFWSGSRALHGAVPVGSDLLPEVLAESLAADWQWPEAQGRMVVQVEGVGDIAALTGVRAALAAIPGAHQAVLVRATRERAWFAVIATDASGLAAALDADPRLPAEANGNRGPAGVMAAALRMVSPLVVRHWRPDLAPAPDVSPGAVQSPPDVPRPE
ncbi:MAG TPA: hypothetical protein VFM34_07835 [Moraxellaceae bacterium]|nr:hypothetical protein [Moraxellaceae bacterium]